MKNILNIKFVFGKVLESQSHYGKNINNYLSIIEKYVYNLIKNEETEILFKLPVNQD